MELRDQQLVSFATLGFFTFSLIHNLANQFTQLQCTIEEARQYLPPETHKQLDQTTQYLSSVLRDSQAMLGRNPACPIWFDLESAILEALELSRYDCFLHKIRVTTSLKKICIQGNRVAFLQIMLNLLKNSIQASVDSAEKTIRVAIYRKHRSVLVTVLDSGHGLPAHKPEESGKRAVGYITGLGLLYIRQQMQTSFQGELTLENDQSGTGCLATLSFPIPAAKNTRKRSPDRQKPGRIE